MAALNPNLPGDHADRMARVKLALEGVWIGDSFGECFFRIDIDHAVAHRRVPPAPWRHTDDTEMALAIAEVLQRHGRIDRDDLAATFAARYGRDRSRGYGAGAHQLLTAICLGGRWSDLAPAMFGGMGSMGNGSAMRVAPVGAYFADDYAAVAREAAASAEVTHFNDDGRCGAIAAALAAAWHWRVAQGTEDPAAYWPTILAHLPPCVTREGILIASSLDDDFSIVSAARVLGNGSRIICPDTVPMCLWLAHRFRESFEEALWATVSIGGDIDTNAAIVGGIVAMGHSSAAVPAAWKAALRDEWDDAPEWGLS